jgi:hypothetical protein
VAEPLLPPLQDTLFDEMVRVVGMSLLTLTLAEFAEPAWPLLHKYVKPPAPPVAFAEADPLALPQVAFVELDVITIAAGWLTEVVELEIQLFASVIVTV